MDHDKYHALRDAAESAFNDGNATALAAVIESGDMLYHSTDWSTWSDEERLVYGILVGYRLSHIQNDNTAIGGKDSFLQSSVAKLCVPILGSSDAVLEIARIVWKSVK